VSEEISHKMWVKFKGKGDFPIFKLGNLGFDDVVIIA